MDCLRNCSVEGKGHVKFSHTAVGDKKLDKFCLHGFGQTDRDCVAFRLGNPASVTGFLLLAASVPGLRLTFVIAVLIPSEHLSTDAAAAGNRNTNDFTVCNSYRGRIAVVQTFNRWEGPSLTRMALIPRVWWRAALHFDWDQA